MAETLEQFLARTTGPRRALPAVCPECGGDLAFEAYYGVWSHAGLSYCGHANDLSFYVPRRMA